MGYRIRMVPEVAGCPGQLRDADPGTAGVVDEANPGPGMGGTRAVPANVEECLTISG